jgi:hypothetical protein
MKIKHNKKRNTAFLFEILARELTKSIVDKDQTKKKVISTIIKEHFHQKSCLGKELSCYRDLVETKDLTHHLAEKLIHRVKVFHNNIDKKILFQEQSTVIKKINKELGTDVFNNFVPNYKDVANVYHIFGEKTSVKEKVLLENKLLDNMTEESKNDENLKPIDSFVVSSFCESYSKKYKDLLPEQKELLMKYIISTGESSVDFKVHLTETLFCLREQVEHSLRLNEVKEDEDMLDSTKNVIKYLDEINVASFTDNNMLKVLKIQNLVNEYKTNAD